MTLTIGSACAGYGGLDMGLGMVLDAEPIWFCEFAPGPSNILEYRYPGVPNHHDLTTTDWDSIEPVDIFSAGWPCQPWSLAGSRKGADDERAIWPAIADAIRRLRPRYVALENVPAIVGVGELARAVGDLAALGYDAQWQCVRASDVGAPHRRERCFILASDSSKVGRGWWPGSDVTPSPYGRSGDTPGPRFATDAAESGSQGGGESPRTNEGWPGENPGGRHTSGHGSSTASDTGGDGFGRGAEQDGGPLESELAASFRDDIDGRGDAVADAPSDGRHERWPEPAGELGGLHASVRGSASATDWGTYRPAIGRWERVTGRPAPRPTELSRNGNQRLSPLLVEWMMGLPEGWVTAVPDLSRNEQLKALGNGVVPQQAAAAYSSLLAQAVAA